MSHSSRNYRTVARAKFLFISLKCTLPKTLHSLLLFVSVRCFLPSEINCDLLQHSYPSFHCCFQALIMAPAQLLLFILSTLSLSPVYAQNVASLFSIPFNLTHHFGYDGPWQAIPVLVSQPQQIINLYPGGTYDTCIPSINVANVVGSYPSIDYPTTAGLYDLSLAQPSIQGSSENYLIFGPSEGGTLGAIDGSLNGKNAAGLQGVGMIVTDAISWGDQVPGVNNVSISAMYNTTYTLPNGTSYPLDVGFLSLGASNNQFFDPFVGNMVPLELSATGVIPSNAWGLHIGSVHPYVPASLVLGGYDQNRVIGSVSAWTAQNLLFDMIINLVDISLGVESGGSPFPFNTKSIGLRDSGNEVSQLSIRPNPTLPYLYLPDETCRDIASELPVTYIEHLDLYAWDTASAVYQNIVKSPSYLAFTFQINDAPGNMTIKVPFALLNLTLTSPLVEVPTQYFPCKSYTPLGSNTNAGNEYHLGRAFLQAAFIGMNWNRNIWWMAQAPGPKQLAQYSVPLDNSTITLASSGDASEWLESWSDILTPLPNAVAPNSEADDSRNTGLSTGAKAGIGVGVALGVVAIVAVILFLFRRSRKLQNATIRNQQGASDSSQYKDYPMHEWTTHELYGDGTVNGNAPRGPQPLAELGTGRTNS